LETVHGRRVEALWPVLAEPAKAFPQGLGLLLGLTGFQVLLYVLAVIGMVTALRGTSMPGKWVAVVMTLAILILVLTPGQAGTKDFVCRCNRCLPYLPGTVWHPGTCTGYDTLARLNGPSTRGDASRLALDIMVRGNAVQQRRDAPHLYGAEPEMGVNPEEATTHHATSERANIFTLRCPPGSECHVR